MEIDIIALITTSFGAIWGIYKYFDEKKKRKKDEKIKDLQIEKLELENQGLKKENNSYEIKENTLERLMAISSLNGMEKAVYNLFKKTKANRFLILYAKNGQDDFKVVTVFFSANQEESTNINALATYRNLNIEDDPQYRPMLKDVKRYGEVHLTTKTLPNCMLKDFYTAEKVNYSIVRILAKKEIDKNNNVLIYSSIATHSEEDFTSLERTFIKALYESTIIPIINDIL